MKVNKSQIQKSLRDLIVTSCQGGIPFESELSIEGLLGITVDGGTVVLVRVSEIFTHDAPKDLSLVKRSAEKRALDADVEHVTKRQRDASFRRGAHPLFGGAASDEFSNPFDESPNSGTTAPTPSLKLPLIHPEISLGASAQEAATSLLKQRQAELSRMFALQGKFPQMTSPERASMTTAAEQLQGKDPQSMIQQMMELNRQNLFARLPMDMTGASDKSESAVPSPAPLPTDLSLNTSTRADPEHRPFAGSRLSSSLGLGSSPSAPLVVVAGTGELQPVSAMQHGLRRDANLLNMQGADGGDVPPVEILPMDDGVRDLKKDLKLGQQIAKKERVSWPHFATLRHTHAAFSRMRNFAY